MTNALRLLSAGAVAVGVIVGLICAPFMWSAGMVDVTGAGLGCVTGAILIAGGLQSLATLESRRAE